MKDLPINDPKVDEALAEAGLLNNDTNDTPKSKQEIKEVTALELINKKVESIPMLYDPIFPKTGLVALVGPSDSGKSAMLRQMGLSTVSGISFLGFNNYVDEGKASCIYVSTEDDEDAMSFLLRKQNSRWGIMDEMMKNFRLIFEWNDSLIGTLDTALTNKPAALVVIDCFSDLYTGRLNEANQVRTFLNEYKQLADNHKCLVLFLHHTGKGKEKLEPSKHNIIGSQAFEAKMRCVIEIREDPLDPDIRHFCITKGNYLPKQYKRESYRLKFDDKFSFEQTGDRTPFELISTEKTSVEEVKLKAYELHVNDGKSIKEIATKFGRSKSTIHAYIQSVRDERTPND